MLSNVHRFAEPNRATHLPEGIRKEWAALDLSRRDLEPLLSERRLGPP